MPSSGGSSGTPVSGGTPLSGTVYSSQRSNVLPLETWRYFISYHPWHFWGFSHSTMAKVNSKCNTVIGNYGWQLDDMAGRDDIRQAIINAERTLREHLEYPIGPTAVEVTVPYPRPHQVGLHYRAPIDAQNRWLSLFAPDKHVRQMGIFAIDVIESAATVTYSDDDGDGLSETFTVTASTTVTEPDEIALYFGTNDRTDGEPLSEKWRIAPISVKIDGGTVTVKGRRWILGKPIKFGGFNVTALAGGLDLTDAANFVTSLVVARRYIKTDGITNDDCQALLIWETPPYPSWATLSTGALTFSPNSADPAAVAYGIARASVRDSRLGIVSLGYSVYNSDLDQWVATDWGTCRQPDRVTLRYVAGVRLAPIESDLGQPLGRDGGNWADAVCQLATARLPQRLSSCDVANRKLWHWQFDLARAGGLADEQYRIDDADLGNPLGTRRGEVYAHKAVQNQFVARAIAI